jgi:predicted small secreted protein
VVRGGFGDSRMFSAGVRRVLIASSALVITGLLLIHLAGCNTVKGVGRDVEAMAQGGQDIIDGKSNH